MFLGCGLGQLSDALSWIMLRPRMFHKWNSTEMGLSPSHLHCHTSASWQHSAVLAVVDAL